MYCRFRVIDSNYSDKSMTYYVYSSAAIETLERTYLHVPSEPADLHVPT